MSRSTVTLSAIARLSKLQSLFTQVAELLGAAPVDLSDAEVAAVNREFGKQLGPMALAAADAVHSCPEAFHGLPCDERSLREKDEQVRFLQSAREGIDQLWHHATLGHNAARVDLGDEVRLVVRTAEITREHPALPAAKRDAAARAAAPLFSLREKRQADVRVAWNATNAQTRALKDKEGEVEGLRADLARAEAENNVAVHEEPPAAVRTALLSRRAGRSATRRTPRG